MTLPQKKIISINVSTGSFADFVATIISQATMRISSYVCVANVHMLAEAYSSHHFRNVVNKAFLVTPDGMPLAKAFQVLYNQHQERVDGMSLLPSLLLESQKKGLAVYFYGGTPTMIEKTNAYISKEYKELKVAGYYSPPFRPMTDGEMDDIAININNSGAHLVFVVLGCPKQEIWMYNMKGKVNATMIGIGGALPVLIGIQKRAPKWMQQSSLEWLYRLNQEPRRLFKRYLTTNSKFLFLLAKENFKVRRKSCKRF